MASARWRLGGTARKRTSIDFDRMTPSEYLPTSLRADSMSAFCAGDNLRKRAIFSTSSGGMLRQIHHSIMLSLDSAAFGTSSMFCVDSQNQAPSLRHIFVIFTL